MKIKISSVTDVGTERTNNEDAFIVCTDIDKQNWILTNDADYHTLGKYGCLMVVADGMGGANAGEIASSIAINTIKSFFAKEKLSKIDFSTEDSVYKHLSKAIQLSNDAIMNHVITDPDSIGLGTTIVTTWIIGNYAYIAWCGDSRCYCYNQETGLKQLTKDHSYVQELVDKGEITKKQAFNHPDGNIITKCLGDVDAMPEPDLITYKIKNGDVLLCCSDGLCGYCNDKTIENVFLNNFNDISSCKDNLLRLALEAGGHDNITITLCGTLPDNQTTPFVTNSTKIKRFFKNLL